MNASPVSDRPHSTSESGAAGLASALTRRWVALYTRGISPEAAHRRRSEIESDLWEQRADSAAAGRRPLRLAMDVTGRLIRGLPADIAWRSHMEGSLVSINIPVNRGVGALFLVTVILVLIATAIPGYDTGAKDWESQMRRLSDMNSAATNVTIAFQVLAGMALVAAAGTFAHLLRPHNPLLASISGYGLAAGGILTLGTSAMYTVMLEFSRRWAEDPAANTALGDIARAFGVGMDRFGGAASLALVLSVGAMALASARARLVPRWAIGLPALGVPVFLAGALASASDGADGFVWVATGVGFLTSVVWLIVSGIALITRDTSAPPPAGASVPA